MFPRWSTQKRAGFHALGVGCKLLCLVIAIAVRIAPDGRAGRLVRRPFEVGVVEVVPPLENQAGGDRDATVEAKYVNEVAGEHSPDEQESPALDIDDLRRGQPVLALLLGVHQTARVVGILVAVQCVTDPVRIATGRPRPIHRASPGSMEAIADEWVSGGGRQFMGAGRLWSGLGTERAALHTTGAAQRDNEEPSLRFMAFESVSQDSS